MGQNQALDIPTLSPQGGVTLSEDRPYTLEVESSLDNSGDRELTFTMTPPVRVAQAPRRHRADNRKVFMVAAPRREE